MAATKDDDRGPADAIPQVLANWSAINGEINQGGGSAKTTAYSVCIVHEDRQEWAEALGNGLREARPNLPAVRIIDAERLAKVAGPRAVVYLGSPAGKISPDCTITLLAALDADLPILPVVSEAAVFMRETAPVIQHLNAQFWPEHQAKAPEPLVHVVLELLGLEDTERRVFISHRRTDALEMAEQLRDYLSKHRFDPFIDRFDIAPAASVQNRIEEALSETAFVLLLESPDAASSRWVLEEVHYALRHTLGMLIIHLPGASVTKGTQGLPRLYLTPEQLRRPRNAQFTLRRSALMVVGEHVERIHAESLVRRRNRLVRHTARGARQAGYRVDLHPGPMLLLSRLATPRVAQPTVHAVVRFTPRPPRPDDAHKLDLQRDAFSNLADAVLVCAEEALKPDRSALMAWCIGTRRIVIVPDGALRGYWTANRTV